ncbi:MAG: hypothetical protein ACI8VC_000655 [Candidatus Endobugula sp.]
MPVSKRHLVHFLLVICAVFPALLIIPIDWIYINIIGINYVDITMGMILYYLFLPVSSLILLVIVFHSIFIKKNGLKKNVINLFCLLVLLFIAVIRLFGLG